MPRAIHRSVVPVWSGGRLAGPFVPLLLAAVLLAAPVAAESVVSIDWVGVNRAGNAADVTGRGAVAYRYRIGRHEVTNSQYADFLNAVAAADAFGLYDEDMAVPTNPQHGGIERSGAPGSYSYQAIAGREDKPVNHVSFHDALRFVNWLHNGQPSGAQDTTTTEDGAYTLTPASIASNTLARNPGAAYFLPSRDEWYKAAYFDPVSESYYAYPTGSDTETACVVPGATPDTANCWAWGSTLDLTDGGSYTASASPFGTFDQGGNVEEWLEDAQGDEIGVAGGHLFAGTHHLLGSAGSYFGLPSDELTERGFRVAATATSVPVVPALPPSGLPILLLVLGGAGWTALRPGPRERERTTPEAR